MMTIVFGGASSGKSEIAENIARIQGEKLCYIATMLPFSLEAKVRVEKHKRKRLNKGFSTIEKYTDIRNTEIANFDTALLECMGNLLANEMYDNAEENAEETAEETASENIVERIICGIEFIKNNLKNLVIVTNDVFKDCSNCDVESKKYIDNFAKITCRLFEMADVVIETKCGIPIYLKGERFEKSI